MLLKQRFFCFFNFLNKISFTFFLYPITASIELSPNPLKSITFFLPSSSFPFPKDYNCFFKISILSSDPDEGKLKDRIVSSPLLINIGFRWSNWLALFNFLSFWDLYWKKVLNWAPICIFFVDEKYNEILFIWDM